MKRFSSVLLASLVFSFPLIGNTFFNAVLGQGSITTESEAEAKRIFDFFFNNIKLLNEGDNSVIDNQDESGHSLLHIAILLDHLGVPPEQILNMMSFLISKGINLNTQTYGVKNTALNLAVRKDNRGAVKLLINAGANVDLPDKDTATPLYSAATANKIDILKDLIKAGANLEIATTEKEGTPLIGAAAFARYDTTIELIKAGSNVNAVDHLGRTPLHNNVAGDDNLAVRLKITKLLINSGADLTIKDNNEATPLFLAVFNNNSDMAREIIMSKRNNGIDSQEIRGFSPLHFAASRNNLEIAELLLSNGANVNIETYNDGITPIYQAITRCHTEMYDLLRKYGASKLMRGDNDLETLPSCFN